MKLEQRTFRMGTAIIVCAIIFRLLSGGALGKVVDTLTSPEVVSFLLYLETGRVVRPVQPLPPTEPDIPETTPPETQPTEPPTEPPTQPPTQPPPAQAVFSPQDADLVAVNSLCGYDADIEALLKQPLDWDLTAGGPSVLIVHTHGSESYINTENYTPSSDYRTLDTNYNVVSVGSRIAELLEAGGIGVIHDTTLHDYPSYTDSYNNSRDAVKAYLKLYPSIRLVLDIHRDAVENSSGNQIGYTVNADGQKAARMMFVVGTDANGLPHPSWQKNMALAVKFYAQLEKTVSGICRPISFRSQRFNQDLSAGAMLIEMGAAGNTRQEALLAAEYLSETILHLAHGTA